MCFYSQQSKTAQELECRFQAKFKRVELYQPNTYNGFQFPETPVITNKYDNIIELYQWGLIPHWAKDDNIKKYTLNARIETIKDKAAFRFSLDNRCLILADGFFEWQWLDPKGKQKQKYLITLPDNDAFAYAGLWSEWKNKKTNEIIKSYTILTTEANELMSRIHNTKKRMPVILSKDCEKLWLIGRKFKTQNDQLIATEI